MAKVKLVHDTTTLRNTSKAPALPMWTAKQLSTGGLIGCWEVYDENGDTLFVLPAAYTPKGPGGVGIDTARLEGLITFIMVQRVGAYNSGLKTGEEMFKIELRQMLGLEDLLNQRKKED